MRQIILFAVLLFMISCMTEQQNTFKDELPNIDTKLITQIRITNIQDSVSIAYTMADSISIIYNILSNSKRKLVKFYPTHYIDVYWGDTNVVELSYRDNFFKYKGISFELSKSIIIP